MKNESRQSRIKYEVKSPRKEVNRVEVERSPRKVLTFNNAPASKPRIKENLDFLEGNHELNAPATKPKSKERLDFLEGKVDRIQSHLIVNKKANVNKGGDFKHNFMNRSNAQTKEKLDFKVEIDSK